MTKMLFTCFVLAISCHGKGYLPGYDFALFNSTPVHELAQAVEKDDSNLIYEILKEKQLDVNFREPKFGQTLLHLASINRRKKAMVALIKSGADIKRKNAYEESALFVSCGILGEEDCKNDVIEILLKAGGDVNEFVIAHKIEFNGDSINREQTLLDNVIFRGCLSTVKLLTQYGLNKDQRINSYGIHPLDQAVSLDEMEILKFLVVDFKIHVPEICGYRVINGIRIPQSLKQLLDGQIYEPGTKENKLKQEVLTYIESNH